jgi:hypothetical protein
MTCDIDLSVDYVPNLPTPLPVTLSEVLLNVAMEVC